MTLLSYGCPIQVIVHAFGLDERTVANWRNRARAHCQKVHQKRVEQRKLDLMDIQANEIRVKGKAGFITLFSWINILAHNIVYVLIKYASVHQTIAEINKAMERFCGQQRGDV